MHDWLPKSSLRDALAALNWEQSHSTSWEADGAVVGVVSIAAADGAADGAAVGAADGAAVGVARAAGWGAHLSFSAWRLARGLSSVQSFKVSGKSE